MKNSFFGLFCCLGHSVSRTHHIFTSDFFSFQDTDKRSVTETFELPLSSLCSDLRDAVSVKVNVPPEQLKLICQGHVLQAGQSLNEQNVKVC